MCTQMEKFLLVASLATAHARLVFDNPVNHVLRQFDGMLDLAPGNASTHFYVSASSPALAPQPLRTCVSLR